MTAKAIDSTGQNDFWHYAVGSDRRGPVPRPTLAKLLASGEISAETYVWQPGMDNWVHLGDAPALKALVAGLEGDSGPEDFVEEDTTFTSQEELRASHKQLDVEEDKGDLKEDTVIEPASYTLPMGSKPKPVAPAPEPAAASSDDIFGAPAASSSATGSDIFSAAVTTTAASPTADIFSSSSPAAEDENIAGVHGRRQSSVLFSLDELGREEGKKPASSGGNEAFVTDSSGLIDIKAVATSHRPAQTEDPFGASGAGLVMPPRASAPGAMAIPIVGRKKGIGPWILAAAVLLVGGGVAAAVILSGNKNEGPPAQNPPVVAQAPKEEPKPATNEPAVKPETKPEAVAAKPETKPEPVVAEVKPETKPEPVVTDAGTPPVEPGGANPADKKVTDKKPDDKKVTDKKPDDKKPVDKPPADKPPVVEVVADTTKPKSSQENTDKVNSILGKLDPKKAEGDDKKVETGDSSLPDKLSAAVVRNTIKGKFGACGSMITTGGPVSVTTSFVIANSGVVQSARVTDAAGVGADVQRCVVGVIKGTTFGKFKDATMTVNLPVKLL